MTSEQIRSYTFSRAQEMYRKKESNDIIHSLFCTHDFSESFEEYCRAHSPSGIWASTFEMELLSVVFGINACSISNHSGGFYLHDSAAILKTIVGEAFSFTQTIWVYHHLIGAPMTPSASCNHFATLLPIEEEPFAEQAYVGVIRQNKPPSTVDLVQPSQYYQYCDD